MPEASCSICGAVYVTIIGRTAVKLSRLMHLEHALKKEDDIRKNRKALGDALTYHIRKLEVSGDYANCKW